MQHKKINEMTHFTDSTPFAALTVGQAKAMICDLFCQEIKKAVKPKEKPEPDALTIEQAAELLTEQGYPSTKRTIYGLVFNKEIPCRKIGRRNVFSRKELLQWIESRAVRKETKSDAALHLAQSVNRKR